MKIKLYFEEIERNFKKNFISSIFSVFYTVITLLVLVILLTNIFDFTKETKNVFENSGKKAQFRLLDNAPSGEIISNYNDTVNLKNFYDELVNSKDYTFYEIVPQPVDVGEFKGDISLENDPEYSDKIIANGTEYTRVNQVYLSKNVFDKFNLDKKINSGKTLNESDFNIDTDFNENEEKIITTPVIGGYSFSKYYKVNDIIDIYSDDIITYRYIFKGFFDKDTSIIHESNLFFLDDYIVTPSLKYKSISKNEITLRDQYFLYLQKINGYIEIGKNNTLQDFLVHFENLRNKYNIFDIQLLQYTPLEINMLKFLAYGNMNNLYLIFFIILVSFILLNIFEIINYINNNLYTYKVLLISGYSIKDIKHIISLYFLQKYIIAVGITLFLMNFATGNILYTVFIFIILLYLAILLILQIVKSVIFYKIDNEKFIRGDKHDWDGKYK